MGMSESPNESSDEYEEPHYMYEDLMEMIEQIFYSIKEYTEGIGLVDFESLELYHIEKFIQKNTPYHPFWNDK